MIKWEVSLKHFCLYAIKYNGCLEKSICVIELRPKQDTFITGHNFYLKNHQPTNYNYSEVDIWRTKTIWKNDKVGGFTLLDFKTYHKFTVIKAVWFWQKDKHIGQWHRTEKPWSFDFDKGVTEEEGSFQQMVLGELGIQIQKIGSGTGSHITYKS